MNKTGFLGLVSDDNNFSSIFSREATTGQLGFAVLNDYFSELLFPSISTLMPNLVYCYLIFALTWGEEKDDNTINEELKMLDAYEGDGKVLKNQNKGFHGDVKENIMGTYRRFMERYGFFDTDKNSPFGRLNDAYAQCKRNERYKGIRKLLGKGPDMSPFTISPELCPYEVRDMIQRCLIASGIKYEVHATDKSKFVIMGMDRKSGSDGSLSMFDLAVFKLACSYNDKNQKEKKPTIKPKGKDVNIYAFENLGGLFDENTKPFFKQLLPCYEAARFASIMQYYVKCRSNELIRTEKKMLRGEPENIRDDENDSIAEFILKNRWDKTALLSVVEGSEACKGKMELLWSIYDKITNKELVDSLIWQIIRNSDSNGDATWNRGETTEYLDTYRWEYRPKKKGTQNNGQQDRIFERTVGSSTKCASYFVGEICKNG